MGIATRLAVALVVSAALLFGLAGWAHARNRMAVEREMLERRARILSDVLARSVREATQGGRVHELGHVVHALAAAEGVEGLAVAGPDGTVLAASGRVPWRLVPTGDAPRWQGDQLSITRPLVLAGGAAYVLHAGLDLAPDRARSAHFARQLVLALALGLLATTTLIVGVVRRWVTAPLRRLRATAEQLAAGELGARPPDERWPETHALARALGAMAERIQESHAGLERRVEERTARLADALAQAQAAVRAREALQRRLVDAERLATLGQMSAQVAHELRNPLNAIVGAVHYLRRVLPREPAVAEYGALIQGEVGRVDRFVSDLLRVARPAAPVFEPADVAQLAAEAVRRATLARKLDPGSVRTRLEPGLPPLPLDGRVVMEALVNLVDNALEAGGPERPELVARLEGEGGEGAGGHVVVEVRDRGPGLPPGREEDVLRPFVTTKPAGTGLGLVIVARAAEQHGGAFALANRPGGGATATLRLPLPAPALEACA